MVRPKVRTSRSPRTQSTVEPRVTEFGIDINVLRRDEEWSSEFSSHEPSLFDRLEYKSSQRIYVPPHIEGPRAK